MELLSQKPGTEQAKKRIGSMFQAHRLEGKVENRGIKNIGKQARKGRRGDR